MLKKILLWAAALLLLCCPIPALGENTEILGTPFPDFTVETVDGETFTLSEALKEKQAVVLNLWATWCPPCRNEFPFLDEAWTLRQDRVAVIALSVEDGDTLDVIRDFREELGLSLPMGRDEGGALARYVGAYYIPTTAVVDRFGNVCFLESGAVTDADTFLRLMDAFLGEDYTASQVLDRLPPVRTYRADLDAADARPVALMEKADPDNRTPYPIYLLGADEARVRLTLIQGEGPEKDFLAELGGETLITLSELWAEEEQAYIYETRLPQAGYTLLQLYTSDGQPALTLGLLRDESGAEALIRDYYSPDAVTWAYTD